MNISLSDPNILNAIVLFIVVSSLVNRSTACSIFPMLNCSCFQSNSDLDASLPIKTYSHLHCKGDSLSQKTFQAPFGKDFLHQNRFRTISIEFVLRKQVEVQTNQFDSLAMLFSLTESSAQTEVSLRFTGFTHIKFHKQAITSNIFHKKHQKTRLSLYFIPTVLTPAGSNQIDFGDDNSPNLMEQFHFSENCLSGLTVSQFNIFMHTLRERFTLTSTFEDVFNNTNVGELHFHGSIIPPGSVQPGRVFSGNVRLLTLHRHVDTVDASTFPYYPTVSSFNIHSIAAHSMNLDSFIPHYHNLRGLELAEPRFDVSIDRFIPTLDSLTLDIEYFNERTLFSARHIHHLKFGSRLRRIKLHAFYTLPVRLRLLDLSELNLAEMTSDSLCYLTEFIYKHSQQQMNLLFPRTETLTGCNCARLILDDIQSKKNFQVTPPTDSTCSKQCRFSACSIIGEHFREKYPLFVNQQHASNQLSDDLPSVDLFSDPDDIDLLSFFANQTNDEHTNPNPRPFTTTTSQTTSQPSEDVPVPVTNFPPATNDEETGRSRSKIIDYSPSVMLLAGIIGVVVLVAVVISSIFFCIARHRRQRHFIAVPTYI